MPPLVPHYRSSFVKSNRVLAKIHIWDCRRNRVRPDIERFKFKIKLKYEIEKYIATKNHDLKNFNTKWAKFFSFLSLQFSVLK